ncbi:MAG TPA: hypothetical protein VHB54_18575 [Mucilaginibacter sp.]|nr:hypothetical protein [Mucilaginibacter sp.]
MADMHLYIRELLNGNVPQFMPGFREDKDRRAKDRDDYLHYIPELCRFIEKEERDFPRSTAYYILHRILPDEPDRDVVAFLLKKLENEPITQCKSLIVYRLPFIKIPAGIDLEPLKAIVRGNDFSLRLSALEAFGSTEDEEGEIFLLEVLRRTEELVGVLTICKVLAKKGTIFSLPVLMARLRPGDEENNACIREAVQAIGERTEMDAEMKKKLNDPSFWRIKWQGSPASFVTYMSVLGMMNGGTTSDEDNDRFAEIMMEEMQVDIAPHQSYRELRLCTSGEHLFDGIEKMHEYLASEVLLGVALNGTGVEESRETQSRDLYFDMMNDYLMTRLRRRISFADDSY